MLFGTQEARTRPAAKALVLLAVVVTTGGLTAPAPVLAQATSSIHISASHPQAILRVDGRDYRGEATFVWPVGSSHYVEFRSADDGLQYDQLYQTRYGFKGWLINGQRPNAGGERVLVITASPEIRTVRAELQVEHKITVRWFGELAPSDAAGSAPPTCGGPGAPPPDQFRVGIFYLDRACYWNSVMVWLPEGEYPLEAYPYPGFVFEGWLVNNGPPNAAIRTIVVRSPMTLVPRFAPAKRVRFRTEPPGLRVYVDRTEVPTPDTEPCVPNTWVAPFAPRTIEPLCFGDFDFALHSNHVIGARSPQMDKFGKMWVFDSFSNGMGANAVYTVTSLQPSETIVARFKPGVPLSFNTLPVGLKLNVNGRDNWPSYHFTVAGGTKHSVEAPLVQTGPNGRKYVFKRWSNGGEAAQEVTVPEDAGREGLHLVAEYELLSRLSLQVNPAGAEFLVDGQPCKAPCDIDRREGEKVVVAAPRLHMLSAEQRLEFVRWTDEGPRERTVTLAGAEPLVLRADYRRFFLLNLAIDPADGAQVRLEPPSPDNFFEEGASVLLTVHERPGFRFRRFEGDLDTTSKVATLAMVRPRSVAVRLTRVPFVAPAGIRNAAGVTPTEAVAPGSLISIFGGGLAPDTAAASTNPLPQALAGVSVVVSDRILPLLFVSPEQINAQLPYDLPVGQHELRVIRSGQEPIRGAFQVAECAPGLFHYRADEQNWTLAVHESGETVTREKPVHGGQIVSLYGTGFGRYKLQPPFGFLLPDSPTYPSAHDVEVLAGDLLLERVFAGGAPGMAGTDVVRVKLPENMSSGSIQLRVRIAGQESNTVLLPVE
jgi:uncharacterized protein (TIGR03437 family)